MANPSWSFLASRSMRNGTSATPARNRMPLPITPPGASHGINRKWLPASIAQTSEIQHQSQQSQRSFRARPMARHRNIAVPKIVTGQLDARIVLKSNFTECLLQ
ncbi:MAG: hypothetical protein WCV50_02065 [Patescibacteria group bacterium]